MNILFHLLLSISFYLIAILIEKLIGPHLEKDEPPLLKHKVPLIGHVLGLIYYGPNYYTSVAENDRPPIFTLGIFGTRSYVVNTSQIIASIQKNARTLSFAPLIPYVAERIAGLRAELCRTWFVDDGTYTKGMGAEHAKLIHHTLYTIDGSLDVNAAVLAELKPLMDEIPSWGDKFGIYKWMIHVISQTSFGAVYGPDHPMNDPQVEKAFWEFENNAGSLLTSAIPWLTARTAWNGRKKLAAGFLKYYKAGNKQASNFVSMRRKLFEEHGFRIEDIAQFEAGMSTPILSNTAPALFWLIREIYSRKSLLEDIRKEIQDIITTSVDDNKEPQYTLEVAKLKKECPLLIAAYHEILRLNGIGTSARRVLQDTMLDNRYLVKKDTLVLMPFSPVHQETKAWGTNAKEFDITRHLGKENRRPAVTFRSFGGAPHLCPGRQIATLEILCIAAMLIARYDVEPTLGYWTNPKLTYTMSGIATPSHDFDVSMKPLPGTTGNWNYRMGDVKLKFPLASN